MSSLYKSFLGLVVILPGLCFPQGKLIVNGAKVNVMNAAYLTAYDVSMMDTSLLNVDNSTLKVADSITSSSNINLRYGTLEMIGTVAQVTPVSPFVNNAVNDLIVSNTSATGIGFNGAVDIYNSLTYSDVGMKLATNDNLTFKSTAANTAWLGDMTGNTLTGKATVERYVSSRKAWRFLSIPTNTTQTIQQTWQEGATSIGSDPVPGFGIQLSGAGGTAAGFDLYSALPSMKSYNSSTAAWVGVPNTNTAGIKATDGYMVFIRGDRTVSTISAPPTETVLRTKGNLYIGNQTPIAVSAGKFAAMGNPYPSVIDMRNITKSGCKDFFYLWDPKMAGAYGYGAYQTFSNDGSGNYIVTPGGGSYGTSGSISNYIASGQAFLVQGDVGGGSLTFKEAAKTTGSGVTSSAPARVTPQLRANLYGVNADNSTYITDGLLVNYDDNYSNTIDDLDALKLVNTSENLSVKTDGSLLVIERRHSITTQDTIFLNLTGVKAQKYRLEFLADQLYRPGLSAFLEDNYLHTTTPLYVDGTTDVDFTVTSAAASYAANRFRIVFSQQMSTLPLTFASLKAYRIDNNIDVDWKVDNESNIKQYEVQKSTDGNGFSGFSVTAATTNGGHQASYLVTDTHPVNGYNYYRIKSIDDNGKIAYSNVVKVLITAIKQAITVYPNPVVNGIISLQLNNQPEGKYAIRLLNKAGQVIMQKQLDYAGGNSTENIHISKYLPHGFYQLEITKPGGDASELKVIY
jgi:Secretion system C-terminal sorting domain